jgi:Pyridine nucleotide-disulphide oxidoreductase
MSNRSPQSPRNQPPPVNEAVQNDDLAEAMIGTSSLDRCPGIYFIGNYSGRINFFAQQTRALNLVWALITKQRIEAGDRVGIIGGGLAGVTAAVALFQRDVEPELFEQNQTLFRYQKNTATRHVHPSVNFWPNMPLFPCTNFPFLNWHEGTPAEIISAIRKEVDDRFKNIRFETSSQVTTVDPEGDNLFLRVRRWLPEGENIIRKGPYKAVIVACGFGLEKRPPSLPPGVPHSYWHNDDVLPPANQIGTREHVMVSGNGDGGLIDIIRASLERFENGREIIELAKTLDTAIMRRTVEQMTKLESQKGEAHWNDQGAVEPYMQLPTSQAFETRLKSNLSSDFKITFNSSVAGLFGPNSSVIHRIIVSHLIKLGRVETVVGKLLSLDWTQQPVRLRVGTKDNENREIVSWEGTATRVIVRWGAEGALAWTDLSKDEVGKLKTLQRQNFANSLKQAWPLAFYNNAKHFPPMSSVDFLRFYQPQAHRFFADKGCSTAVGGTKARPGYVVFCDSDAVIAELPKTFFGIPIRGKHQLVALQSGASRRNAPRKGDGFRLRPGVAVRTSEETYSTLCCFAQTDNLQFGAIATLHGWSSPSHGKRVYFDTKGMGKRVDAELVRAGTLPRSASSSARADVGFFRLTADVPVSLTPDSSHSWSRVATKEELYGYLGKEVLQVGATSGLVSGKLELCDIGRLSVQADEGLVIQYEGLMAVRGGSRLGAFSRPGDSGAAVFTPSGVLLGMIVALSPRDNMTFAIPLADVLAALECRAILGPGES